MSFRRMKSLLYYNLGYDKIYDTELKWQILPFLSILSTLESCIHRLLGCFGHLVPILWNYRLWSEKQETKWVQIFYHLNHKYSSNNPCFKNKMKKIDCIANSTDWKDNFMQGCHLLPNKKDNWKCLDIFLGLRRQSLFFLSLFTWTRLVDKEDQGITYLFQDCLKGWLISRCLAKESCNIFPSLIIFPSLLKISLNF